MDSLGFDDRRKIDCRLVKNTRLASNKSILKFGASSPDRRKTVKPLSGQILLGVKFHVSRVVGYIEIGLHIFVGLG